MKPLIWKELRTNEHWAILAMTGVLVAMCCVLVMQESEFYRGRQGGLLGEEVQMVTIFGSAIVGAVLGFLQILPDRRRDHWALLVHRPMTRTQIFWAKVISGMFLYAIAMGIPFAFGVIWARTQMSVPFEWGMTKAGIADVLMGFSFYFAAVLTSLASNTRHGFRIVSLVTAGVAAAMVVVVFTFWMALTVIAVTWAVLGTAAWGAFVTGGHYESQPRVSKIGLGISLYVGLCTIAALCIATMIAFSDIHERREMTHFSTYMLDSSGQILVAHVTGAGTQYTDVEGKPVTDPPQPSQGQPAWVFGSNLVDITPRRYSGPQRYRVFDAYAIKAPGFASESLYYLRSARRFVCFSKLSRVVGWIGTNGFNTDKSQTTPFKDSLEGESTSLFHDARYGNQTLLACQDAVYAIPDGRTVQTLYRAEPGERIRAATWLPFRMENHDETTRPFDIAISTTKAIVLVHDDGTLLLRRIYDYDPEQLFAVRLGVANKTDRFFVWYTSRSMHWYGGPSHVVELTQDGQEVGRQTLPALPAPEVTVETFWQERVATGMVPPVSGLIAAGFALMMILGQQFPPGLTLWDISWMFLKDLPVTFTALATMIFLSASAALLCFRRTRLFGFSRAGRSFWTIAGVLLGPIGYVTLLLLHDWPARVACPSCSRPRRVDRDVCEHCGQVFPTMKLRSGDIFDDGSLQGSNEPAQPTALVGSLEGM